MKQCSRCQREMPPSESVCADCGLEFADPGAHLNLPDEFGDQDLDHQGFELPDGDGGDSPALSAVPAVIAAQPAPPAWNRPQLLAIPIAVVGGAIITFGLLSARGAASPDSAAVPAATSAPAPAVAAASSPALGATWSTTNVSRWIGNGRRTFATELLAENRVAIWQREVRPVLVVRCMSRRPEVFVFTDSAAKIEPRTEDHTVSFAFDDGEAHTERWPDSADHDALFAPDGAALAQQLTGARTMRFGFTPHNAPPVVVQFNVAGLGRLLQSAARDCGWR